VVSGGLRLATGPVTWGVDFADAPTNPPWRDVLDDIARSGLGAMELGPAGYLPEAGEELRAALGERSLAAVGSFVFDDLHDPSRAEAVVAAAERAARLIAAAGGTVLVIIDRPCDARAATAGRASEAVRLDDAAWRSMVSVIDAIVAVAARQSLTPCVHPHAGTYLEFADEVERLVTDSEVALCLDTGHLAYAGEDPAAAIERFGSRLAHLHLKDVAPERLARIHGERLGFWRAIELGVFCPMGQGVVDLGALTEALAAAGYAGFATIEQDRVPGHGRPLDDLRASVDVLTGAGFATA
jgi:inosose dehydratase